MIERRKGVQFNIENLLKDFILRITKNELSIKIGINNQRKKLNFPAIMQQEKLKLQNIFPGKNNNQCQNILQIRKYLLIGAILVLAGNTSFMEDITSEQFTDFSLSVRLSFYLSVCLSVCLLKWVLRTPFNLTREKFPENGIAVSEAFMAACLSAATDAQKSTESTY